MIHCSQPWASSHTWLQLVSTFFSVSLPLKFMVFFFFASRLWKETMNTGATLCGTVASFCLPHSHCFSQAQIPPCEASLTNFTAYLHYFSMPGPASGSGTSMYYSFDYSNVHFVMVSTEVDFENVCFFLFFFCSPLSFSHYFSHGRRLSMFILAIKCAGWRQIWKRQMRIGELGMGGREWNAVA